MELLKNGCNLHKSVVDFITKSTTLFIYVPYIKLPVLKELLQLHKQCKAIFVRWELKDILTGASDLEIYHYCKQSNIALYINRRLHLKAYIDNYKSCLLTTANISARALAVQGYPNYNFEIGSIIENLDYDDRLYFALIEQTSTLVTDQVFELIKNKLSEMTNYDDNKDLVDPLLPNLTFLISSLPLSYGVDQLLDFYVYKKISEEETINCAIHDLALYNIPFGLERSVFIERLKIAFFEHPFIQAFNQKVEERKEIYFGEAKAWIQANCSNVPIPRRWEITENIQILYRWFTQLNNVRYKIDRPNHSERLYIT